MSYVSSYTALTPIYQALAADATLLQNTYLNGTGKVHIANSRPENAVNPTLILRARPASVTGEIDNRFEWLLEVLLFIDTFKAPVPDVVRASGVMGRVAELLDKKYFTNGSVRIYTFLELSDGTPLTDPAYLNENFWIARYNLTAMQ